MNNSFLWLHFIGIDTFNFKSFINIFPIIKLKKNFFFENSRSYLYFCSQPIHLGFNVSKSFLIEDSKQFKLKKSTKKCYHLNNDELFGRPINGIWENINK